jgi:hypothetical protein
MSNQRKIGSKFENKNIEENARWNVKNNFRLRKARKINEEIQNRQLESFTTFNKFDEAEGFDTVAEARTAIEEVYTHRENDNASLEMASISAESERKRLYGWTVLTLLTLTGGIIITRM